MAFWPPDRAEVRRFRFSKGRRRQLAAVEACHAAQSKRHDVPHFDESAVVCFPLDVSSDALRKRAAEFLVESFLVGLRFVGEFVIVVSCRADVEEGPVEFVDNLIIFEIRWNQNLDWYQEIERVMIAVLVRGRSQSFNLLSVDSPRVLQVAPTFDPLGMMGSRPGLPIFSPLNGLRMRAYFRRFVMPSRGRVPAIPRPSAGFLTRGEAALAFGALRHGPSCSR